MDDVKALLATYPRHRTPLPANYQAVYEREYVINREGGAVIEGVAQRLEGWMHRRVSDLDFGPILELGAGTLNHLSWEREDATYDIVEPFAALYAGSARLRRVRNCYGDISAVPADERYGRIVSVAVLEHVEDLPTLVAHSALRLADGGVFQAGIPSEGGFLWWLAWRCTTGVSYWLRNRLDYGELMRHEHLNKAAEIEIVVRHMFKDVRVRRFPLSLHHASFYAYIEAREPILDRARTFVIST